MRLMGGSWCQIIHDWVTNMDGKAIGIQRGLKIKEAQQLVLLLWQLLSPMWSGGPYLR